MPEHWEDGTTVMCLSGIYKSEEMESGEQIMHFILDVLDYSWYLASYCKLRSETEETIKSLYTHLGHTGRV